MSLIQDLKMWEDLNMTNKRRMGSNRATSVPSNTRLLIPNLSVHLLCADARLLPDSMATKRWVRQWLRPRQKKKTASSAESDRNVSLWSEVRCFLARSAFTKMRAQTHLSHIHTGRNVGQANSFVDLDLGASRSIAAPCPPGWWNIPTQYVVGANLTTLHVHCIRLLRCSFLHGICLIEAPLTWFWRLLSSIKPSTRKLKSFKLLMDSCGSSYILTYFRVLLVQFCC